MIIDGSEAVNRLRAELSPFLFVAGHKAEAHPPRLVRGVDAVATARPRRSLGQTVRRQSDAILVNVFIHLKPGARPPRLKRKPVSLGPILRATMSLREVVALANSKGDDVRYIEPAEALRRPVLPTGYASDPEIRSEAAPSPRRPDIAGARGVSEAVKRMIARDAAGSAGALVGIVDVQGFDFAHPDFLDAKGNTRFVSIWDQGAPAGGRAPPDGFAYGGEITAVAMNRAIAAARRSGPAATLLEPQSEMRPGSHGTHVASIAAGNSGLCPTAAIAAVLISLTPEEMRDSRRSFYDSTRLVDAIEYLRRVADRRGLPLAINVSLGTNGDAHDGSGSLCQWLDGFLATPGRAVVAAAGNAGQEKGETPDDMGWIMGRIHTSGRVPAKDLDVDIEWVVYGDAFLDVSENELEIWYGAQDRFELFVKPPGDTAFIGPIRPREFIENRLLPNGTLLSAYNEIYHPGNGDNYISVYLSPQLALSPNGEVGGVAAGPWTVRLRGLEVRDGRFHGWIERDDPVRLRSLPGQHRWRFPSFFGERSNVDERSISSLGCARWVVSVANLDAARGRIHISSSQGPTRDDRCKPDVAAPGTDILAANGFYRRGDGEGPWVRLTGTSMASPHVTGIVAEMLRIRPTLTAAQIIGILRRTARPLPGADYAWRNDAGFGQIDAIECIIEAARSGRRFLAGSIP
jgi:subtilisin family serine protease